MTDTLSHTEHGDSRIARDGEILRTEVGSGLHGIAIAGTDDHDEMGVFIEPPECVIGLTGPMDHYVWRTQPEGHRSGHGDTDLVMYSLRKFLKLAVAGNPTTLLPLFAPEDSVYAVTDLGGELRGLAPGFLSQRAVHRFVGYLDGQVDRLLGRGRQGSAPNRPELVERYGYDVKYASHALRLGLQGLEIAEHARLTLPMPEADRERVLHVKSGGVADLDQVLTEIHAVRARIVALLDSGTAPLAPEPDLERVSAWSISAHQRHWSAGHGF
ncbi:nucleotidyltransferase domain-containing protein [Glycomyces sp. L485]|uniref:nucleotidyltransferase domain-containing protein n=1 Tax=Glycomyces sp. L485 TaxID=2909235 RepID=UPI001F4B6449|nr:nucleotidyltransferase domain-containing protein [Glycomyces sp. L485]MCH7230926.1 nucleotidyltransferase domain-containing protein [Glycomyces sp. L485]